MRPTMDFKDDYVTLGVDRQAAPDEIESLRARLRAAGVDED